MVDNPKGHQSEPLARYVAAHVGATDGLGVKGTMDILAARPSRAAFRADPAHTVASHDPPRHAAWLDPTERWRNIPTCTLRRRGSLTARDDLQVKVPAFIAYDNRTMDKPFQWPYRGKSLLA